MSRHEPTGSAFHERAKRLNELHERLHATWARRQEGPEAWQAWERAVEAWKQQYDSLAFPGGLGAALERLSAGDPQAVELALEYLEARPYFFRSQYHRTRIKRLLNKLPLEPAQAQRFAAAKESDRARRAWKRSHRR